MDRPKKLLQIDTNAKTVKGRKKGFMTGILYLAPAKLSGYEVCPQRSAGCTAACLNTAGRGAFSNVQAARIAKTKWYFEDREGFMALLVKNVAALVRKAEREGLVPVVRLNGTSDIPWERVPVRGTGGNAAPFSDKPNIMAAFPHVQFYDYTKITKRALAHAQGDFPANYHLTYSATESNDEECEAVLAAGGNIAMVFSELSARIAEGYDFGYNMTPWPVVDGDATDLRHLDGEVEPKLVGYAPEGRAGVIVGLKAKGKARKDMSGFVR